MTSEKSSSSFSWLDMSMVVGLLEYCTLDWDFSGTGLTDIEGSLSATLFDLRRLINVFGVCGVSNRVKARSFCVCGGVSGGERAGEVVDMPDDDPGEAETAMRDLKFFLGDRKHVDLIGELKQLSLKFSSPLLQE